MVAPMGPEFVEHSGVGAGAFLSELVWTSGAQLGVVGFGGRGSSIPGVAGQIVFDATVGSEHLLCQCRRGILRVCSFLLRLRPGILSKSGPLPDGAVSKRHPATCCQIC